MLNQAVKKLQDEIDKNKTNPAIKAVGGFLINHLRQSPRDAEKILVDGKTIAGAMEEMKKQAQKKQKNGYAVIAPDEGFKIVMDYFGINSVPKNDITVPENDITVPENDITVPESVNSVSESKETVPKRAESAFNINLDDLL